MAFTLTVSVGLQIPMNSLDVGLALGTGYRSLANLFRAPAHQPFPLI
jgi:hypothetical protein